jgi:DNA-binding FadR family transcriptional regulator
MFEKLEKSTYSDRILNEIRGMIATKKLKPGDRLPSERELALQFGVSRASVREAIRSLLAFELVESRTGDGTYVTTDLSSVLEPLSWAVYLSAEVEPDLQEAREFIEPIIAMQAAKRATPEEKKRLLECVQAMEAALGDPLEVAKHDFAFHITLAEASHNSILEEVVTGLQWLLKGLITKRVSESLERQILCQREHMEIYKAVEVGDAKRASEIMLRSVSTSIYHETT